MDASIEDLEARMSDLRGRLREAVRTRDKAGAALVREALREADAAWHAALEAEAESEAERGEPATPAAPAERPLSAAHPRPPVGVPVREQVHQALTILGAPASPKLISATYQAFFESQLATTKLASLRRDEERSFTSQGHARPYYICAALNHDRLSPARGLLAVSTWPLERRAIAPLSPRADFLAHAIGTGEQIRRLTLVGRQPSDDALRLLRRFAFNIPGAYDGGEPDPARVIASARDEAAVHRAADDGERRSAAERARDQLSDAQQLFGVTALRDVLGDTSDGTS
ncbi:hypothetical protein [Streptomyces sp. MZ04]|uniref:hypothetical protein n=1 Tax=Streptomyces sp. MZ04 TaxID=2559236 RepID=UPI00107EA8B5|nr:hypothetical protein [Streptomyces sp. MZ04]TGB13581.1 hypothetical protein E2651_08920 [Streptomyces sp. MZ04]